MPWLDRELQRLDRSLQRRLEIVGTRIVKQGSRIFDEQQPDLRDAARVHRLAADQALSQSLERSRRARDLAATEQHMGGKRMERVAGISDPAA